MHRALHLTSTSRAYGYACNLSDLCCCRSGPPVRFCPGAEQHGSIVAPFQRQSANDGANKHRSEHRQRSAIVAPFQRQSANDAPVGHRQPRAKDLPPTLNENRAVRSPEDEAIDRKLRICRDC